MKWFPAFVASLVVVLSACFNVHGNRACLDPSFTTEERADIATAIARIDDFTDGRADLRESCEFGIVNVHRVTSDASVIKRTDEKVHGTTLGVTIGSQVWIAVDRTATRGDLRQVVQHEFIHMLGMRWPDCDDDGDDNERDCAHVPQELGPAIMTKQTSATTEFTDADRAFCVAAGFCAP